MYNIIERLAPFVKSSLELKPNHSLGYSKKYFRKFFRKRILGYQLSKIKKCIRHSYNNSKYYHNLFKREGLKPSDIKTISDLTKIPYTQSDDLQNDPESFFTVPEEKFFKVFSSAGSSGEPKKAYFTKRDIDKIVRSTAVGGKLMYGINSKDVIRITFAEGYGVEVWGNRYLMDRAYKELLGAKTITTDRLPVEKELEIIKEHNPTIFADVTSRINYLTHELKKLTDLKQLGIKKILLGAEPTPESLRKTIEEAWNADAYIGYGITEVGLLMAGECEKKKGMHLAETMFFTEVVDPKTGEQLEDGEVGKLIFTTFDREGMPMIRYNSNDLGRIIPEFCDCGLPLRRIEIKGRTDDLIPIGSGDNLFTKRFDEAIFSIPEILEYQIMFDRKEGKDIISITAESNVINDVVRKKIENAVIEMPEIKNGIESSKTIAKPIVKLVKSNTFERDSIKFKRLVDNRNLYD